MKIFKFGIIFFLVFVLGQSLLYAQHDGMNHGDMKMEDPKSPLNDIHEGHDMGVVETEVGEISKEEIEKSVGVDEKIGQFIPMDIPLLDENGQQFDFKSFVDKPTLLLLIFYHCPSTCNIMLGSLVGALNKVNLDNSEYKVLTVSFDYEDKPENAMERKHNYLTSLKKGFDKDNWKFAVGTKQNIKKLVDSLGYKFKRLESRNFIHPNVLISLAPDGKIIRYLYGPNFIPFDVGMAVTEASKGTPGVSIKRLLTLCLSFDPVNKKYVFKTFRIVGTGIFIALIIFVIFLTRKKRDKGKEENTGDTSES